MQDFYDKRKCGICGQPASCWNIHGFACASAHLVIKPLTKEEHDENYRKRMRGVVVVVGKESTEHYTF